MMEIIKTTMHKTNCDLLVMIQMIVYSKMAKVVLVFVVMVRRLESLLMLLHKAFLLSFFNLALICRL